MKDILRIRAGECRYCLTDDTPFLFCSDPVAEGSSYCEPHHRICHDGYGRDVDLIESMINGMEWTVTRARNERPNSVPVDVAIRGET